MPGRTTLSACLSPMSCGLAFDGEGSHWSLREVNFMAQELFEGSVEPVEGITSYSWRRVAPSLGVILVWDEAALLFLGDWQDKGQMRSSTAQCRSITQPRNMLCQSGLNTGPWQRPDLSLISHPGNRSLPGMLKTMQRNCRSMSPGHAFALVSSSAFHKESFQTTALQQRKLAVQVPVAGGTGVAFQAASAVMRNGSRLCPAYQTSRCRNPDCSMLHQCAAVLRSGRVCGGRPPSECRDRRRISPADADKDCGRSRRPRPSRLD